MQSSYRGGPTAPVKKEEIERSKLSALASKDAFKCVVPYENQKT